MSQIFIQSILRELQDCPVWNDFVKTLIKQKLPIILHGISNFWMVNTGPERQTAEKFFMPVIRCFPFRKKCFDRYLTENKNYHNKNSQSYHGFFKSVYQRKTIESTEICIFRKNKKSQVNYQQAEERKFKYKKVIEYRRKKNKTRISEILET